MTSDFWASLNSPQNGPRIAPEQQYPKEAETARRFNAYQEAYNRAQEADRQQAEQDARDYEAYQQVEREAAHLEYLDTVGMALIGIVDGFEARMQRAETPQVEAAFRAAYPSAPPTAFREIVDALKAAGRLYERKGTEGGIFGSGPTCLYVLRAAS